MKSPRCFILGLITALWMVCSALGGVCTAEPLVSEALFLPEEGFLRVHSRFLVDIQGRRLHIQLFPQAHITSVWVPGLASYSVQRERTQTLLTISLQEIVTDWTVLELSYEGFLPDVVLERGFLDEHSRWFPVLSAPARSDRVEFRLPDNYQLLRPSSQPSHQVGPHSVFEFSLSRQYPIVQFQSEAVEPRLPDEPLAPVTPYPEFVLEPPALALGEMFVAPDIPAVLFAVDVSMKEAWQSMRAGLDRFLAGITRADPVLLRELIHREVCYRDELVHYLSRSPHDLERSSARILHLEPGRDNFAVSIELALHSGSLYLLDVTFCRADGDEWLVRSFAMAPEQLGRETFVRTLMEEWLTAFHQAAFQGDHALLAEYAVAWEALAAFFQSLPPDTTWRLIAVTPEPAADVVYELSTGSRILARYRLAPGGDTWLLDQVHMRPITSSIIY